MKRQKMAIQVATASVGGLVFGASAMLLMLNPNSAGAMPGSGWLIVYLVSGTWFWAVLTTLLSWLLVRRSELVSWRRYIWAALLALLFLITTTATWYGVFSGPSILEQLPVIIVINLPVAAGIGFVAAFVCRRDWLGLAARLCLPAGLAVVLLVATPPSFLELASSESANKLVAWWSQMAISIGLGMYLVVDWLIGRKQIKDENRTRD